MSNGLMQGNHASKYHCTKCGCKITARSVKSVWARGWSLQHMECPACGRCYVEHIDDKYSNENHLREMGAI